jgi:phosphopantetheinyl transferase
MSPREAAGCSASTDIAASRIAFRVRERGPPSFDCDTDMYLNIA